MKSRAQRGLNPIMSCEGSHTLIFIQYYKNSILYLLGGLLSSKQSLLDLKQKSQARFTDVSLFLCGLPWRPVLEAWELYTIPLFSAEQKAVSTVVRSGGETHHFAVFRAVGMGGKSFRWHYCSLPHLFFLFLALLAGVLKVMALPVHSLLELGGPSLIPFLSWKVQV